MKNLILTLVIILPLTLWGQGWEKYYGNNQFDNFGYSIQNTIDGGYIVTGSLSQVINNKIWVLKLNSQGDTMWTKKIDGNWGISIKQTSDSGFVVLGNNDNNWNDVKVMKLSNSGQLLWVKSYGGKTNGCIGSIEQTFDGGYVFTEVNSVIKINTIGDTLWVTNTSFIPTRVKQINNGDFIIIGEDKILKLNSQGDLIWIKNINLNNYEGSYSIDEINNEFIIVGRESGSGVIIKTNSLGDTLWTRSDYGSELYCIVTNTDGSHIICGGKLNSINNITELYLLKVDYIGNEVWSNTFGNTNVTDIGYEVDITNDGGYIVVGSKGNMSNCVIHIIKTNSQGNITSTFEIPLPNPNRKLEKTVNLKGQEIKPQTNTPIIEIFDDGSVKKKLIIER